ncbi:MAG: PAS domain S-box protein [Dehalococcoidales bacterium]
MKISDLTPVFQHPARHLVANYSKTDDLALSFAIDIERTIKTIEHEPILESMDSTLSLLDFLNTPSFLCNTKNQILDINRTLTKVLGYSSSEMVGKSIASFILKKHLMSPSNYNIPYLADTDVRYIDLAFKKKDRDLIYFELDIHKYELRGTVIIQCVARDITERKKAEEALRLSEANLREKSEQLEKLVEERTNRVHKDTDQIDEVMSQAERAYAAYMDAERQVAKAYHENELQVGLSYKRAETAAMKDFNATLLQAKTVLDEVLQKSHESESYQNAIGNFHDSIIQALATYNDNLNKAWNIRSETIQMAWDIYSKIAK